MSAPQPASQSHARSERRPAATDAPLPFFSDLGAPFRTAWYFRELILGWLGQELHVRYRNSLFGWAWAIAAPLVTLTIYTLAFTMALRMPMASGPGGVRTYALFIFAGLVLFNLFSESAYRAPMLMHENAARIKSSIFPAETLAWIALLRACTTSAISLGVLLIFQIILTGGLSPWLPLLPLFLIPFFLALLGLIWFLAALGAFTRDIVHLMVTIVPVIMIASPIFYSATDLPASLQGYVMLNPLSGTIEGARALLLDWPFPPLWSIAWSWLFGLVLFRAGYVFFVRYKGIMVDVI
jgi:lipopolysaccharide transport system permease protein